MRAKWAGLCSSMIGSHCVLLSTSGTRLGATGVIGVGGTDGKTHVSSSARHSLASIGVCSAGGDNGNGVLLRTRHGRSRLLRVGFSSVDFTDVVSLTGFLDTVPFGETASRADRATLTRPEVLVVGVVVRRGEATRGVTAAAELERRSLSETKLDIENG
jgi:hypothetical protein